VYAQHLGDPGIGKSRPFERFSGKNWLSRDLTHENSLRVFFPSVLVGTCRDCASFLTYHSHTRLPCQADS